MGTEITQDEIKNKEILQTEYHNTTYGTEFNNNNNIKYNLKAVNKNSKNNKKNMLYGRKKKILNKPKSIASLFLLNQKKNKNKNNVILTEKEKENPPVIQIDLLGSNIKKDNKIYLDYFKCILCPMCILIQINPKNNLVQIKCENGHDNEINIDSFDSIYQVFKYTCDRCKKDLSSKFYYCSQCKELICNICIEKYFNNEINKGHLILNESEVNFYCEKHKKKFINFCKNCQKNCCKKCCSEHNSHELLLIKNEIRDNNYISKIEKMIIQEKEIIDKIEQKFPLNIFKNENPDLLKAFNRLISLRKKEYHLKDKILKIYQDFLKIISNNNLSENIAEKNGNLDASISSISSTTSMGEYPENFLMNFYFLKSVNELENEVLTNINDFFDFSEDNKYYKDFSELKTFLSNYKKNLISPEKNLEKFSKSYTINKRPNFIFPLDDGNFIITYDTKIIFYDYLSGQELLIMDEEIFDYTYRIIKLPDGSLLFFGDFLNQIKIEENGSIKVLFTGSHVEILKEIILDENNIIFIDKITKKLKILTNKDINWHKEIFPEYNMINNNIPKEKSKENIDLNSNIKEESKKEDNIVKGNIYANEEININGSVMTLSDCRDAEKLLMNSINNMRQDKKNQIKEIMKDRNNLNNQIKTFDIISIDDKSFIAFQEINFINKETCLRKFNFSKDNFKFNIIDEIYLEDAPLKKSDVLYLIQIKNENNYLAYGSNDKKYFVVFDLDKKINVTKLNMNFIFYKIFQNILLFQNQKELNQYVFKDDEFHFISRFDFNSIICSINFLKDFTLVIDDKKFTYIYSYKKEIEDI